MSQVTERVRARMQKILALARQGVGGEKDNAERMLTRLLEANGLTIEDLDDAAEPRKTIEFSFKGDTEKTLLAQCAAKVLNSHDFPTYSFRRHGRKVPGLIGIDLTRAEAVELRLMFEAHRVSLKKHLKKQQALAVSAYIHKNDIYPDAKDEDSSSKSSLSFADLMAISAMADGLEKTVVHRQIGGPANAD